MPIYSSSQSTSSDPFFSTSFVSGLTPNIDIVVMPDVTLIAQIPDGGTLSPTVFSFFTGAPNATMAIYGNIIAETNNAVESFGEATTAYIGSAGSVTSINGDGFLLFGLGATVTNAGQVIALSSNAVSMTNSDGEVLNTGTMMGGNYGVYMNGSGGSVVNEGLIMARGTSTVGTGIAFSELSGDYVVINSGTISGGADPVVGKGISALVGSFGTLEVRNDGLIVAGALGVQAYPLVALTLMNTGTIRAPVAVIGGDGIDIVVNGGEIDGDVMLGAGNDVFDNRGGTVTGIVNGDLGNDTYRLDGTIQITDIDGTDTIEATVNFDLGRYTSIENLTLLDSVLLGTGNDLANTLTGNLANNRLNGAAGNDTLNGADGDDVLRGGAGRDSLSGGDGDDTLRGGAGNDRLTGGDEADTFQYRTFDDSGISNGTRDIVTDFTTGLDTIDLSRLDANASTAGNQAFTYIGASAFSNVAGQLRFATVAGRQTLEADVNGDGIADFQIELAGVTALGVADLVL